jgi:hypothetical protein
MVTSFLVTHADAIFWIGVALEVGGQLWLLFASYACDVALARWTLFFPPLALFLAFRYPEECLRPVVFCVCAAVMIGLGTCYSPAPPKNSFDHIVPNVLQN